MCMHTTTPFTSTMAFSGVIIIYTCTGMLLDVNQDVEHKLTTPCLMKCRFWQL